MRELLKDADECKEYDVYRYIPKLHGVSVVTAVCNFEE